MRDIVRVVTNRHAGLRLLIRPCRVQGEGACHDVARAIRDVSRHPGVDVVIVARGGGSLEDLWAFNEEAVARAIAASPVPVVSGVGHEIDTTIADFVADVRAATPSNAAEIVVAAARRAGAAHRAPRSSRPRRGAAARRRRPRAGARARGRAAGLRRRSRRGVVEPRAPASSSCRRGCGAAWPAAARRRRQQLAGLAERLDRRRSAAAAGPPAGAPGPGRGPAGAGGRAPGTIAPRWRSARSPAASTR